MASLGFNTGGQLTINGAPRSFGSVNAYSLISGGLSLTNSIITNGMATTLYTGNGTTQSVVTGVDMATQWGNLATETFGGLVWRKSRSISQDNYLADTVRGATKIIRTNATTAEETLIDTLTSFNSDGYSIGANAGGNTNLATYASWNFQTTHRITGTTNHGKAYTCHYNPFTGFTIVKYEGSGLAGHEIPHHLGRKLNLAHFKCITNTDGWLSQYKENSYLQIQTTTADTANTTCATDFNAINTTLGVMTNVNTSAQQHIMYGWANSYFDEANTLIGNYEVGIYQGTGAAGNKVTTRGKPAWVMTKRLDSTGHWNMGDNIRLGTKQLFASSSNGEIADAAYALSFLSDGFTMNGGGLDINTSGGQYLYMVVYDNDSGSGKSKYPRATDTSALTLNATIPFANGADVNGVKNTVLAKNETVSGLTLTQGKNYVYAKNDGTYGASVHRPRFNETDLVRSYAGESPAVYKPNENQWYNSNAGTELVTNGTFNTDVSGWTVSAGSFIFSSGTGRLNNGSSTVNTITQNTTTVVGKKYTVKFNYQVTVGWLQVLVGGVMLSGTLTGSASLSYSFVAQSTTTEIRFTTDNTAGTNVYLDNISVFETAIVPSTPITESRNYLDAIVYADAGGQPTYIEQLPKIEYKDVVRANEYQGKNAVTYFAYVDGAATPVTDYESFNNLAVIRTATGVFNAYFKVPMNTTNYTVLVCGYDGCYHASGYDKTVNGFKIITRNGSGTLVNVKMDIIVIGGRD